MLQKKAKTNKRKIVAHRYTELTLDGTCTKILVVVVFLYFRANSPKSPSAGPNFIELYMYIGDLASMKKSDIARLITKILADVRKIRQLLARKKNVEKKMYEQAVKENK